MNTRLHGLLIGALLTTLALPLAANELMGIRWNEGPNNTRIVLDLSETADYTFGKLDNPPRIYIDLKNTKLPRKISVREVDSRILQRIRHASREGNSHRVVLDLNELVEPSVFRLEPYAPYGHRLVIDLPSGIGFDEEDCSTDTEPHKDVVIVLDAGHGGEDPGAVAINKLLEKDVNLAITRHAKDYIEQQQGFKVVLTRSADYEVPLETRRNIALRERAHLFVSIHADSFKNSQPRGGSVFILGSGNAESELSKWFRQNENRSDWVGGVATWVNSECFDDPEQYRFLNDLAADAVIESSVELGKSVLYFMSQVTTLHPRSLTREQDNFRVTDAKYVVLKNTQVPAILVETGFLSNAKDAEMLSQPGHRKLIGRAIAYGILSHFCTNPPYHTYLDDGTYECKLEKSITRYRVRKGDTLSEIAQTYKVTVTSIQQLNNLGSSVNIFEDQILNIPNHASSN